MILPEIRDYVRERGQASLEDIARHLDAQPDAVRGMLARWIRKGRIRKILKGPACGSSCSSCSTESTEVYEWIDPQDRDRGLKRISVVQQSSGPSSGG